MTYDANGYDANDLVTKSEAYRTAYAEGQRDREQSKPMAETWHLSPTKASGYTNGYRDACTAALAGEREHFADDHRHADQIASEAWS